MTITWKKEYEDDPYIGGMMKCIVCKGIIKQPRQLNSVRREVYCGTVNGIDIGRTVAVCLKCAEKEQEN